MGGRAKFKSGDKVRVINYGHPLWVYGESHKSMNIIYRDIKNGFTIFDMSPELVGCIGIIDEVTNTQGKYQYSINGIPGKHAWYDEKQLEIVQHKLKFFNYIRKLIIMKIDKGDKKKTETAVAVVGQLTTDILVSKFAGVKSKLAELDKTSAELKVTSKETLVIATNNLKEISAYIKEVDETRKILKEPSLSETRMIDSYCKGIDDMLKRFKVRMSSEITNFKILEEARERQAQALRLKQLEEVEVEKKEESALLLRIEKQLNARLYGGVYYTKSGDRKSDAGCIKSSDCAVLHEVLNKSIPPISSFKHFAPRYEEMVRKLAKRISEHQTNLVDVEGIADYARKIALERIAAARAEAEVESIDNSESIQKQIIRETRHEEIVAEKSIAEAGKGIREKLLFKATDELLVPRDFLTVDPLKIQKYINGNKEKVLNDIQQNTETIPGIKFFIEGKYISR